jgi:hypothetical protein
MNENEPDEPSGAAAERLMKLARAVETTWEYLDPRHMGVAPYQKLQRQVVAVQTFYASAGATIYALREMARVLGGPTELPPEGRQPPSPGDFDPGDAEDRHSMASLLDLVGLAVPEDDIASWTPGQMKEARDWAGGEHLAAIYQDGDVRLPKPDFLAQYPPSESWGES